MIAAEPIQIPSPQLPPLYPKQRAAILSPARYTIIEATTKAGKTAGCLIWILREAWNKGRENRNWWWVAPVIPQAKIAFRRLKRMLRQFDPAKVSWDHNETELRIELRNGASIWFKGSDDPDGLYGEDVYGAVIDEATRCFVAGTLVETPRGFVPIETIKIGDSVFNASGTGTVRRVIRKSSKSIAVVKVQEYTMASSVDHRYFTHRGWVEARHLERGDVIIGQREAVRILREPLHAPPRKTQAAVLQQAMSVGGNYQGSNPQVRDVRSDILPASESSQRAFLRNELLSEMENGSAGIQGQGAKSEHESEVRCVSSGVLGEQYAGSFGEEAASSLQKFHAQTGVTSSRVAIAPSHRTHAKNSRWERRTQRTPKNAHRDFGRRICSRTSGSHRLQAESGGAASVLPDRYSSPRTQDRSGDRRQFAPDEFQEGVRREEGCIFDGARVESVAVYESGSDGFNVYSGESDSVTLYDLSVSGHPSFNVNGLLVHNCKEESWHAVRSTLTATGGPVKIIGNVRGRRNWAYKLAQRAKAGAPNMAYFKLTAYDAVEGGILPLSEIEDAKATLPEQVFKELYLAEPSDDGGNPFGLDSIAKCVQAELAPGPAVAFGADLAKSQDWTVVCGLNADGKVCQLERWQGPWGTTRRRIIDIVGDKPVLVDSTGVGDPVFEDIALACPNAEGFKFTSQSKQQLMEGLATEVQQEKIGVLDGWLRGEMEAFEYEYRPNRGIRYSAPEGMHDDGVCGLALAVRKLRQVLGGVFDMVYEMPAGY